MKLFSIKENGYPKTLLILVVILLVSLGMCGLQFSVDNHVQSQNGIMFLIAMGVAELLVVVMSVVCIVGVLIMWIVSSINKGQSRNQ